jgi:hypothetical protein
VFFTTWSSIVDGDGLCTAAGWGGPACPNQPGGTWIGHNLTRPDVHIADLPLLFAGSQPSAAGPMKPDPSSFTLLDFGDMMPVDATRGSHNASGVGRDAIDVALTHGGTQFGCCPKTAAGPSNRGRRVIVGNLGNYNPGKRSAGTTGTEAADENTLSLPRDLSLLVTEDGHHARRREILQRYVPELKSLRNESSREQQSCTLQPVASALTGGVAGLIDTPLLPGTTRWLGLRGKQLELLLQVSVPEPGAALPAYLSSPLPARFGLDVLATNSSSGRLRVP